MAIGQLPMFQDPPGMIDSMGVFLHLEKELPGGGRAVDERHLDGIKAEQMVTVDMTEKDRGWSWFVRVVPEVVDSDTRELVDNAIECRHGGGTTLARPLGLFQKIF